MDCRNNPCDFAIERGGQRTQGRCRCWDGLPSVSRDDRRAIRGAMQEAQGRIAALEAQLAAAKATLDEVDSILPDGHGEAGGLGVLEKAERSARCVRESAELSLKLAEAERTIAELRAQRNVAAMLLDKEKLRSEQAEVERLRSKLTLLSNAAHMAVDNQLIETEADRARYRRAIRLALQEMEGE